MPTPLPKPATPPVRNNDASAKPTATPPVPVPAKPQQQSQPAPKPVVPVPVNAPKPPAPLPTTASAPKPPAPTQSIPAVPNATPAVPAIMPKAAPPAPPAPAASRVTQPPQPSATPAKPVVPQAVPPAPQAVSATPPSTSPQKPSVAMPSPNSTQPVAPTLPQQPVRIQQPPQTLTALSSMASNKLPPGSGVVTPAPSPTDPKKTGPNVTATPQTPKTPNDPQYVQPKKSISRFLPFIGGGILLLLILGFVAFRFLGFGGSATTSIDTSSTTTQTNTSTGVATVGPKVTLEYWGLWEPSETMASVIKEYESKNQNVTIKYNKQSHQDYRVRLQNALNSENGPDIFRYHAAWVPMMRQQLAALPVSIISPNEYQNTFYPVAVNQLQSNGQIVGIPLMYDGLVLYYNKELFETAVVEPPKTWSDLRTVAAKLKLENGSTLTRGGVAMGNATNVEHFADILAVLILQNGGDLTKPNSKEVHDALLFYTNFIKTDEVWNESLPSSTIAFARGDVAMMFAPSWRAHEIKAMNPDLIFATAPLPQLSDTRITWASYWAEGVNIKSAKKDESWKFLKYLSSKEVQQKLFADQAKVRAFGELYSRIDLANELAGDPITSAFMQDAPFAKGWQMSTYTHDDGANDLIIKYYEDAVTALNQGEQIEDVQATLNQGISQVLRQYGISSTDTQ